MSNQVYSNQTQKYFTYPGWNDYRLSDLQEIRASASAIITFDTTHVNQQPTIIVNNTGIFTFLETGIYSIRLNLGLIPDPEDAASIVDASLDLVSTDTRSITSIIGIREFIPAAATFGQNRLFTGSFTGWFQTGDTIQLDFNNSSDVDILINHVTTSLIIARIY